MDELPFVVVHCPDNLKPGERAPVLARFATEYDAIYYLDAIIAKRDPRGLSEGFYSIDNMLEEG